MSQPHGGSSGRDHRNDYAIPIKTRSSPPNWLQTAIFALFFNASIFFLSALQFIGAPLYLSPATRPYFERVIAFTKRGFGQLLLAISQLFGPTRIVLSFTDEKGNPLDPEQFVKRDAKKSSGKVQYLNLPQRSVWISNHQIYLDWLYLWGVAYFSDLADSIYIILKASLKHIPIVGWGMQFYRFVFLKRNWNADKAYLGKHLASLAERSKTKSSLDKKLDDADKSAKIAAPSKLLLLVFPEGTLVSENTRPESARFAAKMGYKDLRNMVLPRSTGLFFCLRALAAEIDDLYLLDYTIGYAGIPPQGYGQDYYTLRSVFMQGVPPPAVHMNCIITKVTSPSDSASSDPGQNDPSRPPLGELPPGGAASGTEQHAPNEAEKAKFDQWLRDRWELKDGMMDRFYRDGDFVNGAFSKQAAQGTDPTAREGYLEIPLQLRSIFEFGDLFAWGFPAIFTFAVARLFKALIR